MANQRRTEPDPEPRRVRRATTPQGRERQLSAKAYDAIERRIDTGEATGQELIYFAKMGSRREQLERQKIKYENELLQARTENLAALGRNEELMIEAIAAFSRYSGQKPVDEA